MSQLIKQHRMIKERYPDAILWFKVGEYYQAYLQDAVETSRVLGTTLTTSSEKYEVTGFPKESLDQNLSKMVHKSGHKVAIVDPI